MKYSFDQMLGLLTVFCTKTLPDPHSECVLIMLIYPVQFYQVHTVSLLTFLFLLNFNRNSFYL